MSTCTISISQAIGVGGEGVGKLGRENVAQSAWLIGLSLRDSE